MSAHARAHAFISLRLSPPLDWRSRSSFSVAGSRPRATSARHRSQTRRGIRVAKRRARGMMTAIQDGCPAQETTPINPRIRTQSRPTLLSRKTALPRRSNLAHESAPPSLAQPGGATLAATPVAFLHSAKARASIFSTPSRGGHTPSLPRRLSKSGAGYLACARRCLHRSVHAKRAIYRSRYLGSPSAPFFTASQLELRSSQFSLRSHRRALMRRCGGATSR